MVCEMELDRVLEIPNMEDRLVRPHCHASSSQQNMEHPTERHGYQQCDLYGKDITISSSSPNDTEKILRHAETARSLSDALDAEYHESSSLTTRSTIGQTGVSTDWTGSMEAVDCHRKHHKMSYLTRCRNVRGNIGLEQVSEDNESLIHIGSSTLCAKSSTVKLANHPASGCMVGISQAENFVLQDKDNSHKFGLKRKNRHFCYDSQSKIGLAMSRALPADISQGYVRQKKLEGYGDTSPCTIERNMVQSVPPNAGIISEQYYSEEVDLSEARSRIKQRKLVQGEYVPKNENTGYNRKLQEDKIESMVCKKVPDGPSTVSSETENVNVDCCGRYQATKKENASTNDDLINEPYSKYVSQLGRSHKRAEDNVIIIGQSQRNVNILTLGNPGSRRTHNRTGKSSVVSSSEVINIHKIESPHKQGARSCLNNALGNSEMLHVSELDSSLKQSDPMLEFKSRSKGPNIRGRKCSSLFNSHNESANSVFNDSEVLYLGTFHSSSIGNQIHQRCNTLLDPIMEVDKLHSPDATFTAPSEPSPQTSYGSRTRIRQIESDELFAHQLQEQMFNESQALGIREEIDAALALSLQQEEHAQPSLSYSRQDHNNARNRLGVQLHSRVSSRNCAKRISSARCAKLVRCNNLQRMDMDTRLDIVEELEAAFDNYDTMSISHTHQPVSPMHHHNFRESDYEMLLLLDDNNHQSSRASEIQINTLPQSVLQTDNVEDCAICLDKPSVGDTIRRLPCLHMFHKDCIDEWLRQKIICPICNLEDFLVTSPRLS